MAIPGSGSENIRVITTLRDAYSGNLCARKQWAGLLLYRIVIRRYYEGKINNTGYYYWFVFHYGIGNS
jgi:hypothetical protein